MEALSGHVAPRTKRGRTDDIASTELIEIDPVSESDIEDTVNGVDLNGTRWLMLAEWSRSCRIIRRRSNPLVVHSALPLRAVHQGRNEIKKTLWVEPI